ncbi:hypothetical protein PVL29_014875 [Vitis rotundifolia]|uniref:Uncharacterized protein n=1 Tax=Vitis rotundifolia TaxID=103349 RepID=A0AA39DLY7_VITRO|nr:hypothetical protein PVL29_014875 [Vitis rotundifolia]
MNSLSRTFVKLLSSPSTRNRVLLPLLTTLNQSSSSSSSSSSSLLCHFTAAASTQKYPSRKSNAAQQSSWLSSASVIEPSAKDHPRDRGAPSGDWPRPSEIPWQAKVCNSVNLIGKVHAPVQFQQSSDGKCWAVTVIAQDADAASHSPALWLGSLELAEGTCIYEASKLMIRGKERCKIILHQNDTNLKSKSNLVENPDKWWDNRSSKVETHDCILTKEKAPDFKHKDTGEALWLSSSPAWVLSKLPPIKTGKNVTFTKRETLLS